MKRKIIFELIALLVHGLLHPIYDLSERSTLIKIKRKKDYIWNWITRIYHIFIVLLLLLLFGITLSLWKKSRCQLKKKKKKMSTDKEK